MSITTSTAANVSAPEAPRAFTEFTLAEARAWCTSQGWPAYRADQLWQALYRHAITDYQAITAVPAPLRAQLVTLLPLCSSAVSAVATSADGSEKRVLKLADGETVESVWIPMGAHATVCVSSQVGCPIGCRFCASGMDGVARNLTAGEIVEQIVHAARAHPRCEINNVVFMGMGEPLLNWAQVARAIRIMNDPHGLCIGMRRITVSTVGIPRGILRLAEELPQVNLAVSLHAADDALRRRLIPRCPCSNEELLQALRTYYALTRRRVTFEYVLLHEVNDRVQDARRLAALVKTVPCKVNVIAYNEVPGAPFRTPPARVVHAFVEELCARHVTAVARRRKGGDIAAACGQLRRTFHSVAMPVA
ncbi:MAG: 23S rRNA (adenine(2503)-C(2))-methyltransferase RlmN [bacterium]|nr:23S rRNA (adenine(2503)-C(2))-methyltransferase RlmN [bacterium]